MSEQIKEISVTETMTTRFNFPFGGWLVVTCTPEGKGMVQLATKNDLGVIIHSAYKISAISDAFAALSTLKTIGRLIQPETESGGES